MPVIDSIAVAAIAMPYRPARWYAPQIAAHTASTGHAVDFIEMPRPAMMLVAWPVVEAFATCRTGRVFGRGVVLGDDDHRAGQHEADHGAAEDVHRAVGRVGHQFLGDRIERDQREHGRDDHALVQRVHDLAAGA